MVKINANALYADYTPTKDVSFGEGVECGGRLAVTLAEIKAGRHGKVCVKGVFAVGKGSVAIPRGKKVYWDALVSCATARRGSNRLLGTTLVDAKNSDSTTMVYVGN